MKGITNNNMKEPMAFETIAEAKKEWEQVAERISFEDWVETNEVFIGEVEKDLIDVQETSNGQY